MVTVFIGILVLLLVLGVLVWGSLKFLRDAKLLLATLMGKKKQINQPAELVAIMRKHNELGGSSGHPTSEQVIRENCLALVNMVVGLGDKARVSSFVRSTSWQPDQEYPWHSFLIELEESIQNEIGPHFIFNLDWKAAVEDLNWLIDGALEGTQYAPELPSPTQYPSNASILYSEGGIQPGDDTSDVFADYIRALNNAGLGVCFLETLSDYFLVFMYEIKDHDELHKKVVAAGFGPGSSL